MAILVLALMPTRTLDVRRDARNAVSGVVHPNEQRTFACHLSSSLDARHGRRAARLYH
ncbi:hypothetical protein KDL01_19945 [Actinospica durhamensis]|uniref:Uncharacterized protein n=1 Tax=Actinospica durhamensis TaxID=1508375 RepID=A0A941IPV6_9ACTN|nr:hypothetical protein [Actinospica durhamensis]MBR7835559.1 hypothetical protein [Actinospica durhamensis]